MAYLTLDNRRQARLAKFARPEDETFTVEIRPNGTIILTPADVISKDQLVLNNHPEMLAALAEPEQGRVVKRERYRKR